MPTMPPTHNPRPGAAEAEYERRRAAEKPWRRWYQTARWSRLRAAVLHDCPTCIRCSARGRTVRATVVNHIRPHKGDPELFWLRSNLEPVCDPCHNGPIQREEQDDA